MPSVSQLCGWVPRPDETRRLLSQKENPTFKMAAPHLAKAWNQEEIGLWNACKKVNNGNNLPPNRQTIGDCVSQGYGRGMDYLYCVKQAAGLVTGFVEDDTEAMTEYIYGSSRKAGNALGWGDGSNGIWAVNGLKREGYVFRKGKKYDGQLAKNYGYRGPPADLIPEGKKRPLADYALCEDPTDAANGLLAGATLPICSNQGFTTTRDANGICRASGTWNHCMLVIGLYKVGGQWYFVILQSWGENPSGPVPAHLGFPTNAFGCHWDTMGRILRQRDSFLLVGVDGWQPLPPQDWIM